MQDLNKLISLFIGLFVVIFVIAFALGRFKIAGKKATPQAGRVLGTIFNIGQRTATPTPTTTPKKISIKTVVESPKTTAQNQTLTQGVRGNSYSQVTTIPKTGPELLVPLFGASLAVGFYLKRKS